jgi:hypothetical protein
MRLGFDLLGGITVDPTRIEWAYGTNRNRPSRSWIDVAFIVRIFKHIPTGDIYEVVASEKYLPPLRRRIIEQCGGDPEWENESVFQHQVGLDVPMDGTINKPVVTERSSHP